MVVGEMTQLRIPTLFAVNTFVHFTCPDVYTLDISEIILTSDDIDDYQGNQPSEFITEFESELDDIYDTIHNNWNYYSENFIYNILFFETLISKSLLTKTEAMDPQIISNSMPINDFLKYFDVNFFWDIIIKKYITKNDQTIITFQNTFYLIFIKKLLQKMTSNYLQMIKDYLVYSITKTFGVFMNINFFTNNMKRRDIIIELFCSTFGYYLQSIYEKSCRRTPALASTYYKKRIEIKSMFDELKKYCICTFSCGNIFSDATNKLLIKKLSNMEIIIGTDDFEIDMNEMPEMTDDFFENICLINSFYFTKTMELITKPIRRSYLSWSADIFSFEVNAFYDTILNVIYLPTCMFDDLFFRLDVDPIYNYGGLGSILGHEIMHSFDNIGAQYDYKGHLNNCWTPSDYANFNKEIDKIKKHYSMLKVNNDNIDSIFSIPENMADIAGLKVSLRTYITKYIKKPCDGFTPQQKNHLKLFFARWASNMRTVVNDRHLKNDIKMDVHSPYIIRINAPFSHISEYYEIFDVKSHHQNYLDAELRTKIMDITYMQ